MKRSLAPVFVASVMTGCVFSGGDLLIDVSGKIPVEDALTDEKCTLKMVPLKHVGGGGRSREVYPDISAQFIIFTTSSGKTKYYFSAECLGGRFFRSREFIITDSTTHIDLGLLIEEP